ncbi:type II toxin-antitoxin system PemK/MazF family toxin [Flavobacteriaceae bacterium]|nr:type II toxin-antitoxin system PemK/MazF family toxin [Flavobacteriaceae bacterium]
MTLKPFDIVIIPFPFSDDIDKQKYRPALVVSSEEYNKKTGCSVFIMITSAKHSSFYNDYVIKNYDGTNLQSGCIIRYKFFTLDNTIVKQTIGRLNDDDIPNIKDNISNLF